MERDFDTVMIEQCAPTLAGIKPASLFRFECRSLPTMAQKLQQLAQIFSQRGLRVTVLKTCPAECCYLVYIYRPAKLAAVLQASGVRAYLIKEGYRPADTCEAWLAQLSSRLNAAPGFPHEIGIFLGYPLADVIGFVQNQGQKYTCCGCWKAYGNPDQAEKLFRQYRKCTDIYLRCFGKGATIARLTVAA